MTTTKTTAMPNTLATTPTTPLSLCCFDLLCDDVVAQILSYLDFPSAVRFTTQTNHTSISKRILSTKASEASLHYHVWHEMYKRHCFSPMEQQHNHQETTTPAPTKYILSCRNRRRLFQNLMEGLTKKKPSQRKQRKAANKKKSCFNLPNRYFHFLPISPLDDNDDNDNNNDNHDIWGNDSPPVDFACRSFVLTCTGVGSELLFLDPFDGTVTIHANVTQNTQKSDEAMMEHAMIQAAHNIIDASNTTTSPGANGTDSSTNIPTTTDSQNELMDEEDLLPYVRQRKGTIVSMDTTTTTGSDESEHEHDGDELPQHNQIIDTTASSADEEQAHIAGTIIDESIYRNFNSQQYKTGPTQILFDIQDYFDVNLSDYFWGGTATTTAPNNTTTNNNNNAIIPRGRDNDQQQQQHIAPRQHHNPNRAPIHIFANGGGEQNNHNIDVVVDDNDDMAIGMGVDHGDEIVIDYIGLDSKPILNDTLDQVVGTMVGVGRTLSNQDDEELFGVAFDNNGLALACTEMLLWKRCQLSPHNASHSPQEYTEKLVCRLGWLCCCLEICAKYNKLFAVYYQGDGPKVSTRRGSGGNHRHNTNRSNLRRNDNEQEEEEGDDAEEAAYGGRHIFVYPLVPFTTKNNSSSTSTSKSQDYYFPNPEYHIECQHSIASVVIDVTGQTLLVGTVKGTIEVFDLQQNMATRRHVLDIKTSVRESAQRLYESELMIQKQKQKQCAVEKAEETLELTTGDDRRNMATIIQDESTSSTNGVIDMEVEGLEASAPVVVEEESSDDDNADVEQQIEEETNNNNANAGNARRMSTTVIPGMPPLNPSRIVESLYFPLHLPVEQCGFVSLQHHQSEGTTLLLWSATSNTTQKDMSSSFQVVSVIHLPLSAQRKPRVFYDGRRLIVFGQDHIGMIILVYHVFNTLEDIDSFVENDEHGNKKKSSTAHHHRQGDDSAGVYNLTNNPIRCKFANRIRHAGLGGLEYYDSVYMTCNERFIVVNTKTGNLVGGGGSSDEGLLIIDLQEHS